LAKHPRDFVVAVLNCRKLEAALQGGGPGIDARFEKISRLHRQCVAQATSLARGLRLLPSTSINIRQPPDSPQPIPGRSTPLKPVVTNGHTADSEERNFATLRHQQMRGGFPRSALAPSDDDGRSANSGTLAAVEPDDGVA
jgi:hypothetical protein